MSTRGIPKIGVYPQIIHFSKVFHYKPSILGYPFFWKHPQGGFYEHVYCVHVGKYGVFIPCFNGEIVKKQNHQLVVSNIFYFTPYLGRWSNLTHIFHRGWFNHQPENHQQNHSRTRCSTTSAVVEKLPGTFTEWMGTHEWMDLPPWLVARDERGAMQVFSDPKCGAFWDPGPGPESSKSQWNNLFVDNLIGIHGIHWYIYFLWIPYKSTIHVSKYTKEGPY